MDTTRTGEAAGGQLFAVSDLHVAYPENRELVRQLRPPSLDAWLLIAGDLGEISTDVEWALTVLARRFARVVWAPGNHELWTHPDDPLRLRGQARYQHLVDFCRSLGVSTPEDPYPLWQGPDGPVAIAPLFLLYDYSFCDPDVTDPRQALARAEEAGVVCTDEFLLHPDPFAGRAQWCRARVEATRARLDALDPTLPTVLVNHFPLVRDPTRVLRLPQFAIWCGTTATADWHLRYRATAVVYGHLHIPRTTWHDGVPHREVSLGYPREWRPRGVPDPLLREVPTSAAVTR